MSIIDELANQWKNPGDILSLLLLIGGDVVQRAIAQLFGVYIQPSKRFPRVYLTPVAFSFGWVGYAFNSLLSVISDKQLMPLEPDCPSILINGSSGYQRTNLSWLLGRILRDHEMYVDAHPGPEMAKLFDENSPHYTDLENHHPLRASLRIDLFTLEDGDKCVKIDRIWILSWATIAAQLGISIIPWALYGNWGVFLVTAAGTVCALMTGGLRQWADEKWPGRRLNPTHDADKNTSAKRPSEGARHSVAHSCDLEKGSTANETTESSAACSSPPKCKCKARKANKTKTAIITRGNGHRNVMVILGKGGAWDLETLATATSKSLPETAWCLGALAVAWVCLLFCVAGLKSNTWFLVAVGGLGMAQNIYASAAPRSPKSLGLNLKPYLPRPTIIGTSTCASKFWPQDEEGAALPDSETMSPDHPLVSNILDPLETYAVRGAIRELEKTLPMAGFTLMPVFFPALIRIDQERYRDEREKTFWQWMLRHPNQKQRQATVPE